MSKAQSLSLTYRLQVLYRVVISFMLGFLCAALLCLDLTYVFYRHLPKAEAIYLAAFISLIFYAVFVISSFSIQSLMRLALLSTATCGFLFLLFLGMR